jgi:hypothetical protein
MAQETKPLEETRGLPPAVPPSIGYNVAPGSTISYNAAGTSAPISVVPSGGSGSGAPATTTVGACNITGGGSAFPTTSIAQLSFVGDTTTAQNLNLPNCAPQASATNATLTCPETRGTGAAVNRVWTITCPAAGVGAPSVTYAPATGTSVDFTGVTTIGSTGNGTITATPSGGLGTGAGATTTINTCTLGGANPGSFAIPTPINLSFVGNTTTAQNLALTCTSALTAQTATLTCNETRGTGASVQRQWPLNCPAGTPASPAITYVPDPTANAALRPILLFNGAEAPGTARSATLSLASSGGTTPPPATTTRFSNCALTGTTTPFTPLGPVDFLFQNGTPTSQNISLTCSNNSGTNAAATLTCDETLSDPATVVQRSWPVVCPSCLYSIDTILDGIAPPSSPGVDAITGSQTGRMNRFGTASTCAAPSAFPGLLDATSARVFDRYRFTPTTSGCVSVRIVNGNIGLFTAAYSSFDPTDIASGYLGDAGSSFLASGGVFSVNTTAGTPFDVVVHEVNPGSGPRGYTLQVDTCRAPFAPSITYAPTPGTAVGFTGVTTIGTTGNGTIAATPSGGLGTGAAATTTINGCTLGGANPGSFAMPTPINLSFVGNTATAQNLALTCTSQQTAQTATLTCNETRGTDAPVQRQWPLNCPAATVVAPIITYAPTTGTAVGFTGVTTIGTTGTGTIAATPSGGLGTVAAATSTINGCTLGGANPGSFAIPTPINLSFVGNTTTAQNLALTCTSQQTAQTATLTCNETRGTDVPVQRQWPLNCPAGTPVAPTITYAPTTGTAVGFTGVTTIGTTGNGTIAATPSGGLGTGAAATSTINGCTLGGANPGSFAIPTPINLSFVGNTTTPQNLTLTCTSQQTAQTATLTCNETRGTAAAVQRQWPLNCPAGTPVAPTITYAPTTGTAVAFTGVTTIGTTGNGTIAATPSGGLGTGAGATTTINTCTLGGTNPGSFAGAAAINLSFVGNTTTAQNLNLTCTAGATAQTATLTCNETRGAAAAVQRQWPLSCPVGTLLPLTSAPVSGATVNLSGISGGTTTTSTITVTNPNPIAVALTCTGPAFPFTATPLTFSIPASGNTPVTVGISPTLPGSYSGTLTCNVTGSSQVLTFSLTGSLAAPIAVNATSVWSLMVLMLSLFGFAAVAVRRQG